jgi:hypothetical protein
MGRGVKLVVTLLAVAAIAYPISRELSARATIQRQLINSLDANDVAALRAWPGSAGSFIEMLHDRCMRANAGNADACTRYTSARD